MTRSRTLDAVVADLEAREQQGLITYGCTVDRVDLTRTDWVRHAYHEALDLAMYLRRVQMEDTNDDDGNCNVDNGAGDHDDRVGGAASGVELGARLTLDIPRDLIALGAASAVYLAMRSLMRPDGIVDCSTRHIASMVDMSPETVVRQLSILARHGHINRVAGEHRNSRSVYRLR